MNITNRITPERITSLKNNEVFCFGSNKKGKHTKGAAKIAMGFGAIYGQAAGLQGKTYGIPTKGNSMAKSLSIEEIKPFVDDYIKFAKDNPDKIFLTTEIGCGLAGYKPKEVAPLFKDAIEVLNIHLPARFWHKLI